MLTLNDGRSELWQWDTGRKLSVDAECSQVHFSNKFFGRSIDVDVTGGVAIIPDVLLQSDNELMVWGFVGSAENGYTKISKIFKVNRRNKPSDYVFTPTEQTSLEEINEKIKQLEEATAPGAIEQDIEEYLKQNPVVTREIIIEKLGYTPASPQMVAIDIENKLLEVAYLPKHESGAPDWGVAGQFAVSDGRGGIAWVSGDAPTDSKYFDINYDGIISLKPEYRGCPTGNTYPYAVSDVGVGVEGSKINELPEKIVIPEVVDGTAVAGFKPGMFHFNFRVKEIVLPDGVSELPDYFARQAENLHTLRNTEHITKLGQFVIAYTRVEKALFPSLKEATSGSLGVGSFLRVVDIGDNITTLPTNFLAQCNQLSVVKGGASVTSIGNTAFQLTRKMKNLPMLALNKVTSIGKNAFLRGRIQFDWSSLTNCKFGDRATPVADNTTDYWTGATYTACENPLVSVLSQKDQRWADETFGSTGVNYDECCTIFSALHVYSALTGTAYSNPDEFAGTLEGIDPALTSTDPRPADKFITTLQTIFKDKEKFSVTVYNTGITATAYQAMCDALARGAYVISECSTSGSADRGHVVTIYGINDIGEVLVVDGDDRFHPGDLDDATSRDRLLCSMPFQNLTGPNSRFVVVMKNA